MKKFIVEAATTIPAYTRSMGVNETDFNENVKYGSWEVFCLHENGDKIFMMAVFGGGSHMGAAMIVKQLNEEEVERNGIMEDYYPRVEAPRRRIVDHLVNTGMSVPAANAYIDEWVKVKEGK